ncbi:MAG: radical SAM protein, partial [Bacteroidota bacterium]
MMDLEVKTVDGKYIVSSPSTGAMSLFSPAEYLTFRCLGQSPEADKGKVIRTVLTGYGCGEEQTERFTKIFLRKLEQQGWFREQHPEVDPDCCQAVYFSITTACNMACSYCYIGDDRRQPDHRMDLEDARAMLRKIKAFSPGVRMAVTGGEPFTHPLIFEILDEMESLGISFTLASNAVLIDQHCASRLSKYTKLHHVQTSLDGMTPEVHSITRGSTWHDTMKGIRQLIDHRIPFSIAPTLHEGNLHEVAGIARFAYSNGGFYAPNHLRKFPHSPLAREITLDPESLRKSIIETFESVTKEFRPVPEPEQTTEISGNCGSGTRSRYVCGNAWFSIDIDWNGDVYPCHLLREKEFILGNLLKEELPVIMERGRNSQTRVRAYDIPKCKRCPFVATCAG